MKHGCAGRSAFRGCEVRGALEVPPMEPPTILPPSLRLTKVLSKTLEDCPSLMVPDSQMSNGDHLQPSTWQTLLSQINAQGLVNS